MDPQSMDVETAKRASTAKEESAPPVTKKPKVEEEEEEEDNHDDDVDSDSDDDEKRNRSGMWTASMVANTNQIPKFVSCSPTRRIMKNTVLTKSRCSRVSLDEPCGENMTIKDDLTDLASLCINKLNEDKGTCVKLVEIVGATVSGGFRMKVYITFMAREDENGPLVEYQAKALRYCAHRQPSVPILCRPSPKPNADILRRELVKMMKTY
ncbi:PREDICTED: uncharacterized protein LOC104722029 [Camelina sativa]|uniref:Uncharacterized protein LOC104722029 n=1 Tax=Camelina sativa TaxID=90675 RepID=A0ABM0UAT6_CAMSA|nr:PREDICTED: uncharacterized protein LOC104722029 [Camelina sativa]